MSLSGSAFGRTRRTSYPEQKHIVEMNKMRKAHLEEYGLIDESEYRRHLFSDHSVPKSVVDDLDRNGLDWAHKIIHPRLAEGIVSLGRRTDDYD